MLEVGNGGMSNTEYRLHFSLWTIVAAPLIAVDQDALGTQGKRVRHEKDQGIWVKPLQNGAKAVVMLNRGAAEQTITLNWAR